jgi:serine/threonine-protein kinase
MLVEDLRAIGQEGVGSRMRARTDRPPYKEGDVIGRKYRIVRVLAEGGFSVIYEAVDDSVGRTVAVKILRPGIARMRSYSRDQMRREGQVLVKLHEITDHVVDVFTAGITEDSHALPYYVMERLKGSMMRHSIEEKQRRSEPYTIEEVISFGITIGMALVKAHGIGVAHRDLKPENVFIALAHGGSAVLKLLDFGLCVDLEAEGELSEQARFTCSLPYAAPEQLEGRRATAKTDVYALGLMLVELLTLRLPHQRDQPGLTPERLQLAIADEPVPDLTALRPDTPARLARLVARCLASTPESRPDAHEVAKQLRDTKLQMEGRLSAREASTDVDEPTIEELHRRMQAASGRGAIEAQVVAGGAPLDLDATTAPPPSPRRGEEVFFVRAAATGAPSTAPLVPDHRPAFAQDATTPDPLPPFAAAAFHSLGPPPQAAAITVMPVIAVAEHVAAAAAQPAGVRPFPTTAPALAPPIDTIFFDSDKAVRLLAPAREAARPQPRVAASEPRQRSFVNSGPMTARSPEARVGPQPYPGHRQPQKPPGFTSTSEPGWQTPAPAPVPRVSRQRLLLGLALAAPILIGLAFAPLLLRGGPAASQSDVIQPPSIPAQPLHAVATATAVPLPVPTASLSDVAVASAPAPSPALSQAPALPVRAAPSAPKAPTIARGKTAAPPKLDGEWKLLSDGP